MSKEPGAPQPSLESTTDAVAREFNVDELEVNILIIAKSQSSVQSAAQFLSRRDWPTKVVTGLGQAIQYIAKEKPDLILISINHPSPKIMKLPNIIAAGFNATCIVFAENPDAKTTAMIAASKFPYKLSGGSSGPNLYRGIRKILNQIYNPTAEPEAKQDLDGKEKSDSAADSQVEYFSQSNSGSYAELPASDEIKKTSGKRKKLRDLEQVGNSPTGPSHYMAKGEAKKDGMSASEILSLFQSNENSDGLNFPAPTSSGKSKPNKKLNLTLDSVVEQNHVDQIEAAQAQPSSASGLQTEKARLDLPKETTELIKETLLNVFNENAELFVEGPVSSLAVVLLKANGQKGFLVVGLSEPLESNELTEDFKAKINKHFASKNTAAEIELGFALNVEQIMLEDWIKIEANHSFQLSHEEHKVDAGIFDYRTDPELKAKDDMISLDIQLIDPEHDLPFKAYLHLKKNGKYFKYVNRGRKMQDKQKQKLEAKDVELTISKEDLPQLKIYCLSLEIKRRIKSLKLSNKKAS